MTLANALWHSADRLPEPLRITAQAVMFTTAGFAVAVWLIAVVLISCAVVFVPLYLVARGLGWMA